MKLKDDNSNTIYSIQKKGSNIFFLVSLDESLITFPLGFIYCR